MVQNHSKHNMSVDDIIKSIKGIINNGKNSISASKKDDILELTDIAYIEEGHGFVDVKNNQNGSGKDLPESSSFDPKTNLAASCAPKASSVNCTESQAQKLSDSKLKDSTEHLLSNKVAKDASDLIKEFTENAKSINIEQEKHSNKNKIIEEMVVDIVRAEVKDWLNNNLPQVVREVLEKEIRRITNNCKN